MISLKGLQARWTKVREHWNDPVSRSFEEQFLSPLEPKIRSGITAIERMNELVQRARNDCQ